jgi:hypothetical protein
MTLVKIKTFFNVANVVLVDIQIFDNFLAFLYNKVIQVSNFQLFNLILKLLFHNSHRKISNNLQFIIEITHQIF